MAHTPTTKPAVRREAEGDETTVIHWRDRTFTVPATIEDLPFEFLELMEQEKVVAAVALVLGEDQIAQFRECGAKVRDFRDLSDQIAAAYGLGSAGESQGS
jgi:hypothetical protein